MAVTEKRKKGTVFLLLGLLFLLAAVAYTGYNVYDTLRAGHAADDAAAAFLAAMAEKTETENADNATASGTAEITETAAEAAADEAASDEESADMPVVNIRGTDYIGVLYFEDLNLTLPVAAEYTDENLRGGPCRYNGTIAGGDIVICAHNYYTHFYKIKTLPEGSTVVFTDANGVEYIYSVLCRESVNQYDVDTMVDNSSGWDMTLFTCYSGTPNRCALRLQLLRTCDDADRAYIFTVSS